MLSSILVVTVGPSSREDGCSHSPHDRNRNRECNLPYVTYEIERHCPPPPCFVCSPPPPLLSPRQQGERTWRFVAHEREAGDLVVRDQQGVQPPAALQAAETGQLVQGRVQAGDPGGVEFLPVC